MNRPFIVSFALVSAVAFSSAAQAQSNPHAGMSAQEHAAMQAAPASGIVTTPADNAMLSAAPAAFTATFPHAMTLKSLKLTGPTTQTVDVQIATSTRLRRRSAHPCPPSRPATIPPPGPRRAPTAMR